MTIPTHKLVTINYTKGKQQQYDDGDPGTVLMDASDRTIIPTFVPNRDNFKAVDVSELSEEERAEMLSLLIEYHEYYTERATSIFNFEDWVEHTQGAKPDVKWRTFNLNKTKMLNES